MTDMPQQTQKTDPAGLGLRSDMLVEVMNALNFLVFLGRVDSIKDGTVTIRDNRGNDLPQAMYNEEVRLSFKHDGDTTMLRGKICGCSKEIWKLDQIESLFTRDQRSTFRQSISTSILARCFRRSLRGDPEKDGVECHVVDVSSGGLMFSSLGSFEIGDRLIIMGVRLTDSTDPFTFSCQVRRLGRSEDGVLCYGCQFERMTEREQDRLLRAIFALQREEIRLQKEKNRY